jgi:hypothetical protein
VRHQQRRRVRVSRAHVIAVDRQLAEAHAELRERIQSTLADTPVVALAPVSDQLAQILERHTLDPAIRGRGIGPAYPPQALLQIVERGVWNSDAEGFDRCRSRAHSFQPPSTDSCLARDVARFARRQEHDRVRYVGRIAERARAEWTRRWPASPCRRPVRRYRPRTFRRRASPTAPHSRAHRSGHTRALRPAACSRWQPWVPMTARSSARAGRTGWS